MVNEAEAAAIRRAWDEGGELAAVVELRRHFPLITDGEAARRCVRAIVGWTQRPTPEREQGWRADDAAAARRAFPGALYDGDGSLLAGDGPELTPELTDGLPHKALIRDTPGREEVVVLERGDRLWLLPDGFGTPPELPMRLLLDLAAVVRRGCKVGLAGRDPDAYAQARDALMLDDSGGRG